MTAASGGRVTSGFLLGLLTDTGAEVPHGRRVALPTSCVDCAGDQRPRTVTVAAPSCIDSGKDCSSRSDFKKLQAFAKAVDNSLKEDLAEIKTARETFLRRACDLRYAEYESKGTLLLNTYGPSGPLLPGGSYLYEMRKWADAAFMLHRQCNRGLGGCQSLLEYLKYHPEDDELPGGGHGRTGSKVYKELREVCEIGKTRSPVPNDGPAWCSMDTGLCEQKSCKSWWRDLHMGKLEPWIDDRSEYDDLKAVCSWIEHKKPVSSDLNKYQHMVQDRTLDDKMDFCAPRWIDGYCPRVKDQPRYGVCNLNDGKWCKAGQIFPGSDMDDTGEWKEQFPEKPVTVEKGFMPLLLTPPMPRELMGHLRRAHPASRRKSHDVSKFQSFL